MPGMIIDGIIGARPNMMKMAPLARALAEDGTFRLRLIHTGQHYDDRMSATFLRELGLPAPAFNLNVGSGPHGRQTARILERYEEILLGEETPRGVIVLGDVTSTLACALAAAKLNLSIAHVEAGLRSGDRSMPEEINRIVADAISDLLFVSEPTGLMCLAREGHASQRIHYVGNIMMDTYYREREHARSAPIVRDQGLRHGEYAYLTLHRTANVDDPTVLGRLMPLFDALSHEMPIVFAVHPRTRSRLQESGIPAPSSPSFRLIEPLGYRENLAMIMGARVVLTDSGGLQSETAVANIPCITLRESTEQPITVDLGTSELVGTDSDRIRDAWVRARSGQWKQASQIPLWDGRTAERIVTCLRAAWA